MRQIIIAIDGFSGTGKSSTAKRVATNLGYKYIDSGAMYRAVTYFMYRENVNLDDHDAIEARLEEIELDFVLNDAGESVISLNGELIEDEIRTPTISKRVSLVAAISAVRRKLVSLQNSFGREKAIVMDGRDIGTVVFPSAELKVFMVADVKVRAQRRLDELSLKGVDTKLEEVENNLIERDAVDTSRKDSPLVKATDAIEIDTTGLTFEDQVSKIVALAEDLICQK